jgi:hypothetical protein
MTSPTPDIASLVKHLNDLRDHVQEEHDHEPHYTYPMLISWLDEIIQEASGCQEKGNTQDTKAQDTTTPQEKGNTK